MTCWPPWDWSTTVDVISKLAQTIALAVAGWWTYSLFVKQRHDRRRANLTHRLMELAIEGERTVVRVEVVVQNIGNVVLAPPKGTVKLYQVRPLPPEILDALSTVDTTDTTRGDPAACELPWKRIAKMSFLIGEDNMVLEPGESDFLACDFVIPALVTSIFVRTELLCGDEDAPDQHWHHETLHELNCDQQAPRLEFKFELQQLTARHNTLVKRVRRHGSIRRVVRAACGSCGVCEADC